MKKNTNIKVGKLGKIQFQKGFYVYVGSAMNSLTARLNRHLSDKKKMHWHIDYLLKNKNSQISDILFNISEDKIECELSGEISEFASGVENFGCSDCECKTHLYYFKSKKEAIETVKKAYDSIAIKYYDLNYFNEIRK